MQQKRAADYGVSVGTLPKGPRNKITDVKGVSVGHCTIDTQRHKTGVTVVIPGTQNPFHHFVPAAACVLNGYGKSTGLIQVAELGTLEGPIALTNTLNVGKVQDALVEYLCWRGESIGLKPTSVNAVVLECNDGKLNDIRHRALGQNEVFAALEAASPCFAEGAVGAGTGMVCHGLKGGIGSASRLLSFDGAVYTLGVLVLANHGKLTDLTIGGMPVGADLAARIRPPEEPDAGSCIAVIATDLPLDARQLGRVARRASVGLARLGSYIGQGSGEIFLAFSTANSFNPQEKRAVRPAQAFHEDLLDLPFRAAAECTEEAVLNALFTAHTVTGADGRTVTALSELWPLVKF